MLNPLEISRLGGRHDRISCLIILRDRQEVVIAPFQLPGMLEKVVDLQNR